MDLLAQCFAVNEFHRYVAYASAFANVIDVCDVWMVECGSRFRLTNKPLHAIPMRCNVGGQNLQRNFAIQFRVLRQIHLTHSARAEFGHYAVVRKSFWETPFFHSVFSSLKSKNWLSTRGCLGGPDD